MKKLIEGKGYLPCDREPPLENLQDVPVKDEFYRFFLKTCTHMQIIEDIIFFSYEEAVSANNFIRLNYPKVARDTWQIGESKFGDKWLIDLDTSYIVFYDIDTGDYPGKYHFQSMKTKFEEFVVAAFKYRQMKNAINNPSINLKDVKKEYRQKIDEISPYLYERYPYDYFG